METWFKAILEIDFVAVLTATVAGFAFGALWYGVLFGNAWLAAIGKTKDEISRSPVPMVVTFIALFVMATMFYGVMLHMGADGVRAGVFSAVLLWLGFVVTTMAINNSFRGARPMLTVIDGGHFLGVLLIIGGVLGWFGT